MADMGDYGISGYDPTEDAPSADLTAMAPGDEGFIPAGGAGFGALAAGASAALPVIGAGLQIGAAVTQAENIRNTAQITAQVAGMNQQYELLDAYKATQAGYTQAARYQSVIDQTVGAQEGEEASHNVNVGYGTAGEIQAQTKTTGFLNQLDIKNQAAQKALGYQVQAINTGLQGQLGTLQGNLQATATEGAGLISAAGTLASGYTRTRQPGGLPGYGYGVPSYGGDS